MRIPAEAGDSRAEAAPKVTSSKYWTMPARLRGPGVGTGANRGADNPAGPRLRPGERKRRAQWLIILVNSHGAWESPNGRRTKR